MLRIIRLMIAYLTGILVAYVLASAVGTQMVLQSLQLMGLEVTFFQRLGATIDDIIGLSTSLLPLMALALLAGWLPIELFISKLSQPIRFLSYGVLGFFCILALHPLLNMVFGVDVFAPTRTVSGLIGQGTAGALGGFCVWLLRRPRISQIRV